MPEIDVRAFGSLQQALMNGKSSLQGQKLDTELPVFELIKKLGISREHVQLVMVNHRAVANIFLTRQREAEGETQIWLKKQFSISMLFDETFLGMKIPKGRHYLLHAR